MPGDHWAAPHMTDHSDGVMAAAKRSNVESGVFSGQESNVSEPDADIVSIYNLLEQKERDLLLAAELGKALLEKNEELSQQNEKMAEDFSQKLEELEQEKYHLRRRLQAAEEEYDLRVNELHADISSLRKSLDEATAVQRQSDKEKSLLITNLTEQNQRLTAQLRESAKHEESLSTELQALKDQVNLKRSSMNEQINHLESLREEINLLMDRKMELERRIELLQGEREGLSSTLDESADRIIMLEKQTREQDSIIRANEKAIDEMQSTNFNLSERLENVYRSMSLSPGHQTSLLNEMEMSDSEKSLNASRRPFSQIDEDEDVEVENPEIRINEENPNEEKEEILSSYQQIKTLCSQLRQRTRRNSNESVETSSSSEEILHTDSIKSGALNSALHELRGLVHDLLRKEAKGACLACGADSNDKIRMEVQVHKTQEQNEKLERRLKEQEDLNKRKDDELLEAKSKLSVTEVKFSALEEERDILKSDQENSNAAKDELIKKAWEVRDAAVTRKNNTEIGLARTRIDLMQVNSQLLDAIKQKVELSQQLDQWQVDMHELLEEQMVKKMRDENPKSNRRNLQIGSGNNSDSADSGEIRKKSSKILSFFQRSS